MAKDELRECPFCAGECYKRKAVKGVEMIACKECGAVFSWGSKAAGEALKKGKMSEFVVEAFNQRKGETPA